METTFQAGRWFMSDLSTRPRWALAVSVLAGLFGVMSVVSGGMVLFVDGAGREAAGNYLPYVVWFNFLAGFAYVAAAAALFLWRAWVTPLAFAIALLTIAVFIAFGSHVLSGGAYEMRTIWALALRSLFWLAIAFAVRREFRRGLGEQ